MRPPTPSHPLYLSSMRTVCPLPHTIPGPGSRPLHPSPRAEAGSSSSNWPFLTSSPALPFPREHPDGSGLGFSCFSCIPIGLMLPHVAWHAVLLGTVSNKFFQQPWPLWVLTVTSINQSPVGTEETLWPSSAYLVSFSEQSGWPGLPEVVRLSQPPAMLPHILEAPPSLQASHGSRSYMSGEWP